MASVLGVKQTRPLPVPLSVQGWLGLGRNPQMDLERALCGYCPQLESPLVKANRSSKPQFGRLVPQVLQKSGAGSDRKHVLGEGWTLKLPDLG